MRFAVSQTYPHAMRHLGTVALLLALLLALTACGEDVTLETIGDECVPKRGELVGSGVDVSFTSDSFTMSSNFALGADAVAKFEDALGCVLDETGAPGSLEERIYGARPIDGTQTDDWEDDGREYDASWSYAGKGGDLDVSIDLND